VRATEVLQLHSREVIKMTTVAGLDNQVGPLVANHSFGIPDLCELIPDCWGV